MTQIISPVVDIVLQLIAADHVIQNLKDLPDRKNPGKTPFSKLHDDDLKNVYTYAQKILIDPDEMYMYLYYTGGDGSISGMTVLKKPSLCIPDRGCFNFKMRVSYALRKLVTKETLRKEIDDIFAHWKHSGEVTFRILSFKLRPNAGAYANLPPHLMS